MKKLNRKAFWLFLIGLIGINIYHIFVILAIFSRQQSPESYLSIGDFVHFNRILGIGYSILTGINVIFSSYVIYRLLSNVRQREKQQYVFVNLLANSFFVITDLFLIPIISYYSLIGITFYFLIFLGYAIQKNVYPTREYV